MLFGEFQNEIKQFFATFDDKNTIFRGFFFTMKTDVVCVDWNLELGTWKLDSIVSFLLCPIRDRVKLANKDWCLNSRILNTVEKSGQVSLDPGFLTVFVLTFIIYLLELGTGNWKLEIGNC